MMDEKAETSGIKRLKRLKANFIFSDTVFVLLAGLMSAVAIGFTAKVALRRPAALTESTEIIQQAYLDRNYYTTEEVARGIIRCSPSKAKGNLSAELEIRPECRDPIRARSQVENPAKTVIEQTLSDIPLGEHPVSLRILDKEGRVIAEKTSILRKIRPAPNPVPEVKVDRQRMAALVNGKPFFPIGVYGVPQEHMKEVVEAGFNCTVRWHPGSTHIDRRLAKALDSSQEKGREVINEYLDACREAGLMVLDWPPAFSFGLDLNYRSPDFAKNFKQFMADPLPFVLETIKDHPAILAYYGPDEPGGYPVRGLCAEYSRLVSQYDPYRPNCYVFFGKVSDWPEVYDIAGHDWYLITSDEPFISVLRSVEKSVTITNSHRLPYWHVPLCEWWSGARRALSGPEQRIQSYLAVIGGAKGMLWWVWPPYYHDNWETLKALAREFSALAPILLEETPAQSIHYQPEEARDTVQVLVQEHDGKVYLITANADPYEAEATFRLPGEFFGQARVPFEERSLPINNAAFSDHYDGYDTHVYELEGAWAAGGTLTVEATLGPGKQSGAIGTIASRQEAMGAKNLLPNSSFENVSLPGWPDYWAMPVGSLVHPVLTPGVVGGEGPIWGEDDQVAFEGRRSLRMHRPQKMAYLPTTEMAYIPVKDGRDYTFSVRLKADRPGLRAIIQVNWVSQEVKLSTKWARYRHTVRAVGNSINLRVILEDEGTLWVDAVQLEAGTKATDYESASR